MVCRLCLEDRALRESHIIPEFLYRLSYDEKHRLREVSTNASHQTNHRRQKGIRENLLCGECENKLGRYEKYVKELLYDDGPQPEIHRNSLLYSHVEYSTLRLFQLSLLWRASIASDPWFGGVKLPDDDEEVLRRMISSDNPGRWYEYPCMTSAVVSNLDIDFFEKLFATPEPSDAFGEKAFRFICGGFSFVFVASRDARDFPLRDLFLEEDGRFVVALTRAEETGLFTEVAVKLIEQGKLQVKPSRSS